LFRLRASFLFFCEKCRYCVHGPEWYRQPLVLRYLAGKTPSEIAHELSMTIGAVEGLLKRQKRRIHDEIIELLEQLKGQESETTENKQL
jgi:hypothetical protein